MAKQKKEKLLIAGCGWKQIAIIDKSSGNIEWKHPILPGEDCNDIEQTRQGNILYAYKSGARLITREHQVIWDYKARPKEELFTATQLKSGNYMLAICGNPSRLVTLNKQGAILSEQVFNTKIKGIHNQFRQITKTKKGTYLVPLMGKGILLEMNEHLQIIKEIKTGGNPFSVKELDCGNWLVSCGDAHNFVEINPKTKQIVKKTTTNDLQSATLLFVAEIIRYKNGNTLIANWNGHSKDKSQPLLLEIDSKNKVAWSLPLQKGIKNISSVFAFYE